MQTQESPTSALVLCSDLIVFTTWSLLLPLRARRPQSAPECDGSDKNIANCIRRLVETHKWAAVAVELASIVPNCPQSLAVSDAPLFTTYWIGQRQKRSWGELHVFCVVCFSIRIKSQRKQCRLDVLLLRNQGLLSSKLATARKSSTGLGAAVCLFLVRLVWGSVQPAIAHSAVPDAKRCDPISFASKRIYIHV